MATRRTTARRAAIRRCYDPQQKDISRYLGGDLRGLEKSLQSGYFNDLGVTALWLTPVVKNVWRSGYDLGGWKTGYHGYWAQDWLDIDPHLTSRVSLTGEPYADDAEGRMEHYRDFVKLAHSKGIKVIQDVVINHAGPVFLLRCEWRRRVRREQERRMGAAIQARRFPRQRQVGGRAEVERRQEPSRTDRVSC